MIKAFAAGGAMKRVACSALMDEIEHGLHAATISATDFDVLQFCRFMRRVYPSSNHTPDAHERFHLMKAMSEGCVLVGDLLCYWSFRCRACLAIRICPAFVHTYCMCMFCNMYSCWYIRIFRIYLCVYVYVSLTLFHFSFSILITFQICT
jgi:hypothetical protein